MGTEITQKPRDTKRVAIRNHVGEEVTGKKEAWKRKGERELAEGSLSRSRDRNQTGGKSHRVFYMTFPFSIKLGYTAYEIFQCSLTFF